MARKIIGTICPVEVIVAIRSDISDISNKKMLLVNNNELPEPERARVLRHYNNGIVELEHDMSTLFN